MNGWIILLCLTLLFPHYLSSVIMLALSHNYCFHTIINAIRTVIVLLITSQTRGQNGWILEKRSILVVDT